MASKCTILGKSSWPELVGTNGEYALTVIPQENPNIDYVEIVPVEGPGGGPPDVDCRRVRVMVDQEGNVVKVPTIG